MSPGHSMAQIAGQSGAEAFDYSQLSDEQLQSLVSGQQQAPAPQQAQVPQDQAPEGWNGDYSTLTDEQLQALVGGPQVEQDFGVSDYVQQVAHSIITSFGEMIPATIDFVSLVGDMVGIGEREDSHAYAEGIRDFVSEIVPSVPGLEESFLASTLPGAIGSTASFFIPGAAAGKVAKGAGRVADLIARFGVPGSLGAMQEGAGQFYEAEAAGASEEDSWKAFALGTAVGTSEALPISQILNRANNASGGLVRRALIEGTEELLQESGQTVAANAIAQSLYEEDRELLEHVVEGGAAGFLTGVLFSSLASASERRLRSRKDDQAETDAPQPEGVASVQAQVEALNEGRVDAFFLPPESAEPEGLTGEYWTEKAEKGTLYLSPEARATYEAIEEEGLDPFDELGRVLGYGTEGKPEAPTHVLAARDESGRLVRGTLVDEADLDVSATALAAATRAAGPKGTVETVPVAESGELLEERAGERATVKTASLADASAITRVLGPDVREVQAPQGTGQAAQKFGQKRGRRVAFVEQASGKPLTQSGFINKATGTLFLDANAGTNAHLWGVLAHEMTHALADEGGDLAVKLTEIAPEVVAAFTEQYAENFKATFGAELPDRLREQEGVALLTENLGGFLQYAAQNPEALEKIGAGDRSLFQKVVDLVVSFLETVGIDIGSPAVRELKALQKQIGTTEFETTADPELIRTLATTISGALNSTLGTPVPPPVQLPDAGASPIPTPLPTSLPAPEPAPARVTPKQAKRARKKAAKAEAKEAAIIAEGKARVKGPIPEGPRAAQARRTEITAAEAAVEAFEAGEDVRFALPPKEAVRVAFGKTGKTFRKNLTAMGNLPAGAFNAKIARDGSANVELKEMQVSVRDFDAAVSAEFGPTPGVEEIERIDAAFRNARKIRSLPKPLQGPVRRMREHVDILSRRMIDVGVIAGQMEARFGNTEAGQAKAAQATAQLEEHIQENLGFYATRSYAVFDDPNWSSKVPVEVRDKAKALLRSEHPDFTEPQLEGMIEHLLYEGKAAQSPIALLARSKLGSKDLSILTRRKAIAPEIRALFGEYKDARVNYARSVMKMGHLIANHQFLAEVKSAGLGTWLLERPEVREDGEFKLRIAADESSAMFPLNGLYTTPEIEQAFREATEREQVPDWLRVYMKANSAVKFAKTIGSPMTHVRNMVGNIGFAVANGHWQFWQARTAAKGAATNFAMAESLIKDKPKWRKYFKRAIEVGVVHEDARGGEIRDMLHDAARSGPDDFLDKSLAGKVRRFVGLQADIYQSEDDVWKLYAWENEKARYRKAFPDVAEARLEEMTASIVRNTYPTYSLVPRFIKRLRRFPLVGNFVSFPWEVMRVTGNTFRQMAEELNSDNKELKKIGAQRLAGMALAAVGTSTAAAASRFMLGLSGDDDDDARLFMAPWDRNSDIIWIGGNEDGNRTWINISYTDPYSYLKKPIIAFMRGEDADNAIVEAGTELLSPFFGEEMLAGKLIDIQRNTTETGGSVYNPEGSWQQIAGDVAEHVGETFKPGAIVSLERIWKGVTDYVEPYGKSYDPKIEALAVATGIRLNELDIPQSLSFRASDYSRSLGRATSGLSSVASRRGTVTDQELREAYEDAETSRRRLFAQMERAAKAAIALGVPRDEVERVLRSTLSEQKTKDVMRGEYSRYIPSSSFLRSRSRGASEEVVEMYNARRELLRKLAREEIE